MLKPLFCSSVAFLCCTPLSATTPGLAAYRAGETDVALAGKALHVTCSDPRIVAVATAPQPWGYFQFPTIARTDDGALLVKWAMNADSITAYGKRQAGWRLSRDQGRTWVATTAEEGERALALHLPNDERLAIHTPAALKASELSLPAPVGSAPDNYSKVDRKFYRVDQLPAALQGVYLKRYRPGEAEGKIEHATLEDPGALRYELQGLLPVVWWGNLRVERDGSLVAGVYPGFYQRADGSMDWQEAVSIYRSADLGRSWKIVGKIPYQFDGRADPKGAERRGYTEPAFEILADGTYLCVSRTTDGIGNGPMYVSRSRDRGITWTRPEAISANGVLPKLLRLENGLIVLASGRPGVQMRFARADAAAWSEPLELVEWKNESDQVSCGYTGLVATGPDRFVIAYSNFNHRTEAGETRKAIAVREFSVSMK